MRKVLWMMPRSKKYSELWMHRMLESIEGQICAVVTNEGGDASGRFTHRSFSLHNPTSLRRRIVSRVTGVKGNNYELNRIIKKTKPDVIFINYLMYAKKFENVLDSSGLPVICHVHSGNVTDYRIHQDPDKSFLDQSHVDFLRRIGKKWTIIANSEYSADMLCDAGVGRENIRIKYFGSPLEASAETLADKPKDSIGILFLGRLADCKGPELTIRAFERVCDAGYDAKLTIAGDGEMRVTCAMARMESKHRARIDIVGKVNQEEGKRLRATHHIFTAHSRIGPLTRAQESFGVAFLEAMAAGLPVVTGHSGGIPELITHEKSGFLFEPGDLQSHADYLKVLIKDADLRRKMSLSALESVRSDFSMEQEKTRLEEIISQAR